VSRLRGSNPKAGGRGAIKAPKTRRDRGAPNQAAPPPARARFKTSVLAARGKSA